jgi:VWFA-related protein
MNQKKLLALCAAVVCSSAVAIGDQGQSQSSPQTQASSAGGQDQPVFRASIDLVTTDVIPRNTSGQFVADLSKDHFQVFEDDVPQKIASVVLVHGGRVFNQVLPPPPPPQEGIILPPVRPTNDAAGRVFILFVDDLHLDFRDTHRVRDLFRRISKTLIHQGDLFGIVSTGTSSISIDLTYDRSRIEEAINKITGGGLRPSEIIQGPDSPTEGPTEVRYRAHVAFSTAGELLKNLQKLNNRRKAVIYVSNGYDFNPYAAARSGQITNSPFLSRQTGAGEDCSQSDNPDQCGRRGDPNAMQGQMFADADLAREEAELTRSANRANATLYTIDPRGLVAGADLDEQVDPVQWQATLQKMQDSLRVLAENTGGVAVVNTNDFDRALRRIDNETSDYYVLGYYSNNPDPTRRTRKIEVKVNRSDVNVWSRTSYSLPLPPAPAAQATEPPASPAR